MAAPKRGISPGPDPLPGLSRHDFVRVGYGGLGDGHNSFAHAMAWFRGRLYVGTTRSNLCMLRVQSSYADTPLKVWPVDCPDTMDGLYQMDRRPQIWCYDPNTGRWEMVYRGPMVEGLDGAEVPREIGYRSMIVFAGSATEEPALYVSTWAPGRAAGGLLLRSIDGRSFEPISPYGVLDPPFSTTRSLTEFRGRVHFAPTAQRGQWGGQQNTAHAQIYASATPEAGDWQPVNVPGFDDPSNMAIFSLAVANDTLYAGTLNLAGLQVWATDGSLGSDGFYRWRKICDQGVGRGPLNQAVACMAAFNGALYIGTGIQGGGNDRVHRIGPAAAEILRVNADDSIDVVVGDRDDNGREPLSGLPSGFGNFFNGYVWTLVEYDGWLYCGTYDWSVTLRWSRLDNAPPRVRRLMELVGTEAIIDAEGGADLWRTADGENWLPVCRNGFGNVYNWGIRNLVTTPRGLFVGTANVFGPTVAVPDGDGWAYRDNPVGGMEVWRGSFDEVPPATHPDGRHPG